MDSVHHDIRMTAQKIAGRLELIQPLEYRARAPLAAFAFKALQGASAAPPLEADTTNWEVIEPNSYWGGSDLNFVMHGEFTVPSDWDEGLPIALLLPLGETGDFSHPEALVHIDGEAYATTDRHHQDFTLADQHRTPASHKLVLHGWTGAFSQPGKRLMMSECCVALIDPPTRDLIALTRVALQAAHLLTDLEPAKTRIYNALDAAYKVLETREPLGGEPFYASVPAALETLRTGIAAAGSALDAEIIAAGHAHIDVAWLWTLAQTRRKAGRTFHTALRQLEQFPEFHFTQSQPQLYEYVKADYPQLFEAIKARVLEGRWEIIGGMWVEADCNISGGESLARQFLLGRNYFKSEFGAGVESPVLWLPDVFGYAWNLPQLMKLAGLEYFFTIKIGWNQVNKLPFDSFWWQGLDGTKVLTHFSTTPDIPWGGKPLNLMNFATYNASLSPFAVLGSWAKLQHKHTQKTMLMSYGYGDGGGGPTREMNENAAIMNAFPAMPRVKQGKVIDFFRRLEMESGDSLPTWNAELYLEIHRGTYTTQGRNKRANRKSEFLLHDAELLAAQASTLDSSYAYPHEAFTDAWKVVCLNQFHDIIPGSSIGAVYTESLAQYAQLERDVTQLRDTALQIIARHAGGDLLVVNPMGLARSDLVFWAEGAVPAPGLMRSDDEAAVLTQTTADGVLLDLQTYLEPHAVVPLTIGQGYSSDALLDRDLSISTTHLENSVLRVELNAAGDITRIFDKRTQREVLPADAIADQWLAFEDRPIAWDAWDIDIFYDDKVFLADPATSITMLETGPLRVMIEVTRRILNSDYVQRISLTRHSAQLDFDTRIDWRERHILLKTAFPTDILSPVATHEIQWGNVERPTHRNTSWDWARFETCAQKWVDLSEGDYGVALLNDCKYGHDVQGNTIRLSLLRSPTAPDPEADQGMHHFKYSLLMHGSSTVLEPKLDLDRVTSAFGIARHAYALNNPNLIQRSSGAAPRQLRAIVQDDSVQDDSDAQRVVIETVKRAEDGNGIIVRMYECKRSRGWVTLTAGFALKAACITNLLEETLETLEVDGRSVSVFIKPFQIVTVRLIPRA